MSNEILKYLHDVREAAESIQNYLGDISDLNIYKSNKMLRRAIEREFEIIGEAMSRINKIDPNIQITSKRQITNMRNRVIHGYDKIDDEIVWGTIVRHIPILLEELKTLMS
ncbi:MAG: DUF86 domain-containing protein [Bacteroidetes bacterium]|jgi:uncharacterized protein with HEPN domain|nr:DUF86 domain-containing protein [Bacteroidota bacterium]MBT3749234.1 DUF86 domain-containing protein [Bacteroidota bacterium]MBT4401799.1 DUF86 domain-containing protein [Bacteroidota bacterium]MBT4410722.1 DUF86 domain-containing protein [Bacteroidota bacterium]MBT7092857.1 DUF86 domain-containing protein [Bacteroidota bacterium]